MADAREILTRASSGRTVTTRATDDSSSPAPLPVEGLSSRTLSTRAPIIDRTGPGRTITTEPIGSPGPTPIIQPGAGMPPPAAPAGTQDAPTDGTTIGAPVASYQDKYGFPGVLADLFLRTFGADETDTARPPVVVGDASYAGSSGGANTMLIVLILAGVAGAGYYFFVYKKRHASA